MCERTETHNEDENLPACACRTHGEPTFTVEVVADAETTAEPKKKPADIPHRGWHWLKRISDGEKYEAYAQQAKYRGWLVMIPAVEHTAILGPEYRDVAGLWKDDEGTPLSAEWEYVEPIGPVEMSPMEQSEAVERGKSRVRPRRTGWRDDPKAFAGFFEKDCGLLATTFNGLPDIVDRLRGKHRRTIRREVSNMLDEMLMAFEDCGAVSKEQRTRLGDELEAALDCIVHGKVSDRIVAACVARHSEGECFTFNGFESVDAAKTYYDSPAFDAHGQDRCEIVIYEAAGAA